LLKKISLSLFPLFLYASNTQCDYTTIEHAKYIKQQYQYKAGNINEPCIKVFTINDYTNTKNEVIELPTDSSWVFTDNEECRCQDNKSPESIWNKTFPKNKYTTKDIMITLKSYADKQIDSKKEAKEIEISLNRNYLENSKAELLVDNKNSVLTNYKNDKIIVDENIRKMKKMNNNIFITNKNYIKEIKINNKGNYIISFNTSEDINGIQVFNEDLIKLQEFRYYDPYEIETNFVVEIVKPTTLTIMALNPYGKGSKKGIFDIKINKVNIK